MKKHLLVGLVVIAVISLSGCAASSTVPAETPTPAAKVEASPTSDTSTAKYKDGQYDVVGDYVSPGGPEQIEVKVTLKDNVISDAEVTAKAERPMSKQFQQTFIENYKAQVIGKNINEVNLSKVSGSSLTPQGFNDAITKIKTEAKV